MATVRPLSALRYVSERVDLALVLAPPGAMDAAERHALHEREPRNAVRVLEDGGPDDAPLAVVTRRAALHLAEWRRAGVLALDEHPALYLVRQTPDDEDDEGVDGARSSVGFFAALRLDGRNERDVQLPASLEEVDAALVEAQRAHLEATGVHTGAVLFAYDDESGRIERALHAEMEEREPDLRGRGFGARYELWILDDDTTSARVTRHLEEQPLTLAAGRERYEAALLVERARSAARALGSSDATPASALGFFVKAEGGVLDEGALAAWPPRGLVFAPLVAVDDDDG